MTFLSPKLSAPAPRRLSTLALAVAVIAVMASGCVNRVVREMVNPERVATLDHKSPYLKVHFKNGNIAVINAWSVIEASRIIEGNGRILSPSRDTLQTGRLIISIDSVALFETNVVKPSPSVAALAVVTGVSAAVTVLCITNPKTCFGSCPTFYWSDGKDTVLVAEGFSTSVAPSLEKTDIDALWTVRPMNGEIRLHLTNEALETHVIRRAVLLTAKKPDGGRVVKDRTGRFFQAHRISQPIVCNDESVSCLELVREFDHHERFSMSDSVDLAAKEQIVCEFAPRAAKRVGLLIGFRQTLLSTYLFYQSLAYMGTRASEFLSKLEQGNQLAREAAFGPGRLLGAMLVQIMRPDGVWETVDSVMETGPLASDLFVVPVPENRGDTIRTRIVLNKGHWRIDYLALADMGDPVVPDRVEPTVVYRDGRTDDAACGRLSSDSGFIVTMPGDEYDIIYRLPDGQLSQYEFFLEARGYYLEWMREEWIAEEDISMMALMLMNPSEYLRKVAPEYKRTEADMEQYFWGSRFAH